ncbi:MAG: hypothetical protein ACR2FU_24120, partial [Streptosporangiaceae bacterium]
MTEPALYPHLGWQFVPARPEPESPPARPAAWPAERLEPGWQSAQVRISRIARRPARAVAVAGLLTASLAGGALIA